MRSLHIFEKTDKFDPVGEAKSNTSQINTIKKLLKLIVKLPLKKTNYIIKPA